MRNEAGDVPFDDTTSGEVLIRGPWIAGSYAGGHTPERWTEDGYFRTGDVARVDANGYIQLTDRIDGSLQVRRRVDRDARARERADGPSRPCARPR